VNPSIYLKQRAGDDWLIGYDSQDFFALANQVLSDLERRSSAAQPPTILLAERNPLKFLAYFIAACSTNCSILLANPDWGNSEWQQVFELVQPNLIWGDEGMRKWRNGGAGAEKEVELEKVEGENSFPLSPSQFPPASSKVQTSFTPSSFSTSHILIPTGGTSGKIRFAIHTWETLMASVQGFQQYFGLSQINSFCLLPLYHVSGLMQFLRSFTSNGKLVILPFKAVEAGEQSRVDPNEFFLSLVPTQLQRLLSNPAHPHPQLNNSSPSTSHPSSWLSRFHTVLLGGAPAWPELLETARQHQIRLAPTYGMTETASQIVTLKPDDFLKGKTGCGQVLPHAQVTICSPSGEVLNSNQIGIVTIGTKSLCQGYCPSGHGLRAARSSPTALPERSLDAQFQGLGFQPDDLGYFDAQGYLHIVGRGSNKIITGGENVFPTEVEAAIRETGLVSDVCVIGVNDRQWGEAISAIYVPIDPSVSPAALQTALANKLSRFKYPKHWVVAEKLPRNAQGKINRQQIETMIQSKIKDGATVPTLHS
jgi:O-succinylbenzoic acid--CoA ligase